MAFDRRREHFRAEPFELPALHSDGENGVVPKLGPFLSTEGAEAVLKKILPCADISQGSDKWQGFL